jgi:hypothetical protein
VVDEFHFADIAYDFSDQRRRPKLPDDVRWRFISEELVGTPIATIEQRCSATRRGYRELEPAWLNQVYERSDDGRRIKVVWRRGFGQYALAEFAAGSLGVFVHRGDSGGEGGSNVFYLGNRARDHEPCSNLFDKLRERLPDKALIVSDGSNSDIPFIAQFHRKDIASEAAFARMRDRHFDYGGLDWRCVGYLGPRYGPTLVWQVGRKSSP